MIYAIIIHSTENGAAVHFSHFFTGEGNDESKLARQQMIIRKVVEDKTFQQHAASHFPTKIDLRALSPATILGLTTTKKVSETYQYTASGPPICSIPTTGIVLLNASSIFQNNLAAIWRQFGDLLFTILCERTDNLSMISSNVVMLIEQLCREFGVNKLEQSITEKPEEVETIVLTYMRTGFPLISNHSLFRFIVKSDEGVRPFVD